MHQVRVALQAADSLTRAGLASLLTTRTEIMLLDGGDVTGAQVLVVSAERLTADVVTTLRRSAREAGIPAVLVVTEISEVELLTAANCNVVAVLPRAAATAERLTGSVLAAGASGGVIPRDLAGRLIRQVERLRREGLRLNGGGIGLTSREIDVLRLMADGMDTSQVASVLCFSERTVKNVVHNVTRRLKLRNRPHAVAYALRAGAI